MEIFSEHFKEQKEKYVLIGGSACDIILSGAMLDFRATKNLDIVLILETIDSEFSNIFWDFIKEGSYQNKQISTGKKLFYRFNKPENKSFPYMLELFSRVPDILQEPPTGDLTPIPFDDDASSLSAIILNEEYYNFIRKGINSKKEVPFLNPEYIIPLKAKAYLDLKERKEEGVLVDKKDINKHRNDVFRLYQVLSQEMLIDLPGAISHDMRDFFIAVNSQNIDLKNFGIKRNSSKEIVDNLKKIYSIE